VLIGCDVGADPRRLFQAMRPGEVAGLAIGLLERDLVSAPVPGV
jgi:hypothetical protein